MSVEFDSSASLSAVVPVSPMPLPVDLMRMKKSGLLMNAICVLFLLYSPPRVSFVSVMFDFNTSLNDFAPLSPMLFTDDFMKREKSGLLMDAICVLFLCLHISD